MDWHIYKTDAAIVEVLESNFKILKRTLKLFCKNTVQLYGIYLALEWVDSFRRGNLNVMIQTQLLKKKVQKKWLEQLQKVC